MTKKYKCPHCLSTKDVVKNRSRGKSIQFLCKKCKKLFSIKVVPKPYKNIDLLNDHLDGFPFSKIASRYGMSKTQAYRIVYKQLLKLPENNKFTFQNCNKWSDIYVVDGKYIPVKGYDRDIPFLWGIDYLRHDFPIILLARSESYSAWNTYFTILRKLYSPKLIVCDDNASIKAGAIRQFPRVQIQTCYNHLKESLRKQLRIRKDNTYRDFFRLIENMLKEKRSEDDFNNKLGYIYRHYEQDDVCRSIAINLARNKTEILGFTGIAEAPTTSNIMECFNSHLECRIKSIKGFEDFRHAQLWLNAYVLKRRFTAFKECKGKFKHLNGELPINQTKKEKMLIKKLFI